MKFQSSFDFHFPDGFRMLNISFSASQPFEFPLFRYGEQIQIDVEKVNFLGLPLFMLMLAMSLLDTAFYIAVCPLFP